MNLFNGREAGKAAGGAAFGSLEWAASMKRATDDFHRRHVREKRFPRRDRREPQTGGKR